MDLKKIFFRTNTLFWLQIALLLLFIGLMLLIVGGGGLFTGLAYFSLGFFGDPALLFLVTIPLIILFGINVLYSIFNLIRSIKLSKKIKKTPTPDSYSANLHKKLKSRLLLVRILNIFVLLSLALFFIFKLII